MFVIISVRVYLFFSTVRLTEIIVAIFVQKCELCQKSRFFTGKNRGVKRGIELDPTGFEWLKNGLKKTWHELSKIELG